LSTESAIFNLNTRAVAVEFIVYNPILGLFSIISLVTEMSISGVIVPNAQFQTYQILPYAFSSTSMLFTVIGEFFIYCFFISNIYTWYLEHKKFNLYRNSNIFLEIKSRYSKVVPKLFYLSVVRSNQLHRAKSFSSMREGTANVQRHRGKRSFRHRVDSNLSDSEQARQNHLTKAQLQRKCNFGHSVEHVCQHKSVNPATQVESYTFERHCTKEVMTIPCTPFTLVIVESEIPIGWKLLRGYGNFFFDFKSYQLLMSFMFFVAFVMHIIQAVFYHNMLITDDGGYSIENLIKVNDFKKIQELFSIYGYIISRRNLVVGGLAMMAWFEAVKCLSTLNSQLQVLMMTMQGMIGKLGSWFIVSSFLFFAYSLAQYVIFGSERGMKSFSQYLLEAFTLAVGQSELQESADNIQDAIFEDAYNVIFILLFTIILINLLIAIMTDAFAAVKETAASRYCYSQFEQLQFHKMALRGFKEEESHNKYSLKSFLHIKSLFRTHSHRTNSTNDENPKKQKARKNWGMVTLSTFQLTRHAEKAKQTVRERGQKGIELNHRNKIFDAAKKAEGDDALKNDGNTSIQKKPVRPFSM
jgi:hypothetical protein